MKSVSFISAFSVRALSIGVFTLLSAASSLCALPRIDAPLVANHYEFSPDFPASEDYLIWNGHADHWQVFQATGDGTTTLIDDFVSGFQIGIQYAARPTPIAGGLTFYQVVGYDTAGDAAFSNWTSVQQLLLDPGFSGGPATIARTRRGLIVRGGNPAWIQTSTKDSDGIAVETNFIQGTTDNFRAVLGGAVSQTDRIRTAKSTLAQDFGGTSGQVTLSGFITVDTQESSATDTYDSLVFEIRDVNSGELLYSDTIAVNFTESSLFLKSFDYNLIRGRNVQVQFSAVNDIIFPTTFTLELVELDVTVTY